MKIGINRKWKIKYEIKRGIQYIYFLLGFAVFIISSILFVMAEDAYYSNLILMFSFIILILYVYYAISNKFGIDYEIIRVYEDKIVHIKNHLKKEYKLNEIFYEKVKKHYAIPTGKYSCDYRMKMQYDFYKGEEYLFSAYDDYNNYDNDDIEFLQFVEKVLIPSGMLKKKKTIFNNEEVLEVKTNKANAISIGLELFAVFAFGIIFFVVSFIPPFGGGWFIMLLYITGCLFLMNYFIRELRQLKQKIYVVKEKGFYIVNKEEIKFYKFNEIDKAETECYITTETVDNKLRIYKDDKILIEITNSNRGFYDFIDILKERNLVKD